MQMWEGIELLGAVVMKGLILWVNTRGCLQVVATPDRVRALKSSSSKHGGLGLALPLTVPMAILPMYGNYAHVWQLCP